MRCKTHGYLQVLAAATPLPAGMSELPGVFHRANCPAEEKDNARPDFCCDNDCLLRALDRVREVLREGQMSSFMNPQSLVMLVVTVLTMVYLFYALLRPEKF
jgi:K+-transporting ATPase KdpF subunit